MPELLLYFTTAACWLGVSALAWRASRLAVAAGPSPRNEVRPESFLVPVGLVLHGVRRLAMGQVIRAREADRAGMWRKMRSWFGEVF